MRSFKIVYNVSVDYTDFHFNNADEAITFMKLSASSISKDDRVRIELTAVVVFDDLEEDNDNEE